MNKNLLKFSILFLIAGIIFTSCQKEMLFEDENSSTDATIVEKSANKNAEIVADNLHDYQYYYNGNLVKNDAFSLDDENLYILIFVGKRDDAGKSTIDINAFTTQDAYFEYGMKKKIPLKKCAEDEKILNDYAKSSGAIDYYEKYGEVPDWYYEFEKKYFSNKSEKGVNPVSLYKDFSGGQHSIVAVTLAVMWSGWSKKVSRYYDHAVYGGVSFYKKTFYRKKMASLWGWGHNTVKFQGHLSSLNDKTKSVINH